MSKSCFYLIVILSLLNFKMVSGQTQAKINWINFNQLSDSLKLNQKKVFVNFYAEWCSYCKEMDRTTFQNTEVIEQLNEKYYSVKMNVESSDTITFADQIFINKRIKRVNPVHEIALLLASRKNKPFSLPAFILFDENFTAKARYFQFLDSPALLKILKDKDW